jgi:hypothetical protein
MTAVIAFTLGVLAGLLFIFRLLPARFKRRPQNVDYKERWLAAVSLLGDTGRLTDEQVRRISAPSGEQPSCSPPPVVAVSSLKRVTSTTNTITTTTSQSVLHRMATWDRRDLEVSRAQAGLPPADDLRGMASWDVRDVLNARAEHGTG